MYHFQFFLPEYGPFTDIQIIKLYKILYGTYRTVSDEHGELKYIVIEPIDFERDPI